MLIGRRGSQSYDQCRLNSTNALRADIGDSLEFATYFHIKLDRDGVPRGGSECIALLGGQGFLDALE